jgi:hypothetical protein
MIPIPFGIEDILGEYVRRFHPGVRLVMEGQQVGWAEALSPAGVLPILVGDAKQPSGNLIDKTLHDRLFHLEQDDQAWMGWRLALPATPSLAILQAQALIPALEARLQLWSQPGGAAHDVGLKEFCSTKPR